MTGKTTKQFKAYQYWEKCFYKHDENDINTKTLLEYLNKLGFDQEKMTTVLKDNDPEYAEFEKAMFLKQCYNEYAVIKPMKEGWMQRTVHAYQDHSDREEGEILELWDESDFHSYATSLQNLIDAGVNEKDLYRVIKETQKNALANIMETLDGVFGHELGLFETEYKDDENIPKRQIIGLQDDFLDYDPHK